MWETWPKGEVGKKGEVGEKRSKGNAADVEELQQHLSDRIDGRLDCWIVLTFLTQKKRSLGSAASIMSVLLHNRNSSALFRKNLTEIKGNFVSYFNTIGSHFERVQSHLKKLDF